MKTTLTIFVAVMANLGLCAILRVTEPEFMASYNDYVGFAGGVLFVLLINLIAGTNK
jgi:hypothetical protein